MMHAEPDKPSSRKMNSFTLDNNDYDSYVWRKQLQLRNLRKLIYIVYKIILLLLYTPLERQCLGNNNLMVYFYGNFRINSFMEKSISIHVILSYFNLFKCHARHDADVP